MLHYIDDGGVIVDQDECVIIGSNSSRIGSLIFPKPLCHMDVTINRFIRDVFQYQH
jgi:hypothetical protein